MRIGVVLADGTWPEIVEAAQQADDAGIHTLGFWDHYHSINPEFEPHNGWALYGFLASVTRRIQLCPLVLDGPSYSIGRLAKETAMLSIMSGGRFELGIGIGDMPDEERAWGQSPYQDAHARIEWLDETISALRLVWQGEPVDFTGKHVNLCGARCTPAPSRPPRVVVGAGMSSKLVDRAVSYADEVNVYNNHPTIERARQAIESCDRSVELSVTTDRFEDFGNHVPGSLDGLLGAWHGQGVD
jgi:alkanesulfonate monooxygenase SsuD/methylene tetrahydromethanopterin reductase-like flavin-dependent oxidoreductase (luciferase family)